MKEKTSISASGAEIKSPQVDGTRCVGRECCEKVVGTRAAGGQKRVISRG